MPTRLLRRSIPWVLVGIYMPASLLSQSSRKAEANIQSLRLHASIEHVNYCQVDAGIFSAQLRMTLKLENAGPYPAIILKQPDVAGDRIARTIEELRKGPLERNYAVHAMVPAPVVEPVIDGVSNRNDSDGDYLLIPSHHAHLFNVVHSILIQSDASKASESRLPLSVGTGNHVMLIEISNRIDQERISEELRKKVIKFRQQPIVTSEPFHIGINPPAFAEPCANADSLSQR